MAVSFLYAYIDLATEVRTKQVWMKSFLFDLFYEPVKQTTAAFKSISLNETVL